MAAQSGHRKDASASPLRTRTTSRRCMDGCSSPARAAITPGVYPQLRSAVVTVYWINAAALRMQDEAVIILDPLNCMLSGPLWQSIELKRRIAGKFHADGQHGLFLVTICSSGMTADLSAGGSASVRSNARAAVPSGRSTPMSNAAR